MNRTETSWGPWEPATLADVAALFSSAKVPWWIAGGYAIELAVGYTFREHSDIDVLLLRRDQGIVQTLMPTWEWWAADPPGTLRPWRPGEPLSNEVHDVWCRPGPADPWRIQIMLDEAEGQDWVSRRCERIRRRITRIGTRSVEGVPYLTPEVQLFYKAHAPRPKDEEDFGAALPVLDTGQRQWLADAITQTYGDHPWVQHLR
ncbi:MULTISPECIES: nucleotidyltransferase domain-containing protein [Streptomyces]|uniref:nucleotidyltransferase domain-containing protein n=1 Tax=Streptomyces TaxID=1883 RepID=UPI0022AF5384|nr:amino acid transporter [Streptomyces sp. H39-C1]MCZ4103592.1 amino acid transporter [Streptomyces sp. H39-C1]